MPIVFELALALLIILDSYLINSMLSATTRLLKIGIVVIPWIAVVLFGVCTRASIIGIEQAKILFCLACVLFALLPIVVLILDLRRKAAVNTEPNKLHQLILLLANILAILVAVPVVLVFICYGGPRSD